MFGSLKRLSKQTLRFACFASFFKYTEWALTIWETWKFSSDHSSKLLRPSCGRKGTLCRQFSSSLPDTRTSPSFPLDCSDFHSSQGGSHPCATCLRLTILMQWWCCWQGRTCVSQASCSPPSCPFLPRDSPALEPGALAPWSPWKVSHQEVVRFPNPLRQLGNLTTNCWAAWTFGAGCFGKGIFDTVSPPTKPSAKCSWWYLKWSSLWSKFKMIIILEIKMVQISCSQLPLRGRLLLHHWM